MKARLERDREARAPIQRNQLDDRLKSDGDCADCPHEAFRRGARTTGCEDVIHDSNARVRDAIERARGQFEDRVAVLERIRFAMRGTRKLAGFATRNESKSHRVRNRSSEDEPAALDAKNGVRSRVAAPVCDLTGHDLKCARIRDQWGEISKKNSRLRKVRVSVDKLPKLCVLKRSFGARRQSSPQTTERVPTR